MSSTSNPLPSAWVDRIFARFTAMFGEPKIASLWAETPLAEVKGVWATQVGRFPPDAIAKAMQAVADSGKEWPPTLPEFVALCRQFRDPSHAAAVLPAPGGTVNHDVGRAALAALKIVGGRRQ